MTSLSMDQLDALARLTGLSYYNLVVNPDRTRVYAQAREQLLAIRAAIAGGADAASRAPAIATLEWFLGMPSTVSVDLTKLPGHVAGAVGQRLELLAIPASSTAPPTSTSWLPLAALAAGVAFLGRRRK